MIILRKKVILQQRIHLSANIKILYPEEREALTPETYVRRKVLEAACTVEIHMALSCIAMGIPQSLSIRFIDKISFSQIRCQRTPSRRRVSEATFTYYFQKLIFAF